MRVAQLMWRSAVLMLAACASSSSKGPALDSGTDASLAADRPEDRASDRAPDTGPCAVSAVSAGDSHTCVLTTAGGVRCWGYNGDNQLGDGTDTNQPSPPAVDVLSGVQAIAAGGYHSCALTT